MGYRMWQSGGEFKILRVNHGKVLEALTRFVKGLQGKVSVSGYVRNLCPEENWRNLILAFGDLRWNVNVDVDYNIIAIQFGGENLWDDKSLFEAVAPYVEDGSFIEMTGDEGEKWRWVFKDGGLKEIYAKVVWEE